MQDPIQDPLQHLGRDEAASRPPSLAAVAVDVVFTLFALTAAAFAFAGLFFWFSAYANDTPGSGGALSPFLLALIAALVAGAALLGALRERDQEGSSLAWASRFGFVATAGFVVVGGVVPEYRDVREGADWAVFKWVAVIGFYGASAALLLSVSFVMWRLSVIRVALRSGIGSMPSLSLPSLPTFDRDIKLNIRKGTTERRTEEPPTVEE